MLREATCSQHTSYEKETAIGLTWPDVWPSARGLLGKEDRGSVRTTFWLL